MENSARTPVISVQHLGKVYEADIRLADRQGTATRALSDITLSIEPGEFVAIMGPSGSGKSTLLHILGFLDRHTEGEYRFEGKLVAEYSPEELAHARNRKMGFIFQAFNLLARASVLENVKLPLLYSGIKEELWDDMARDAIYKVGLAHRLEHEPSQLSGGEKQRVAIARALVLAPQVIFADEPTGNLDSKSGQIVMEVIQRLNEEEGHTVILVTHETYTAEHAQRILHVKDGKIERDEKVPHRHRAEDIFKK